MAGAWSRASPRHPGIGFVAGVDDGGRAVGDRRRRDGTTWRPARWTGVDPLAPFGAHAPRVLRARAADGRGARPLRQQRRRPGHPRRRRLRGAGRARTAASAAGRTRRVLLGPVGPDGRAARAHRGGRPAAPGAGGHARGLRPAASAGTVAGPTGRGVTAMGDWTLAALVGALLVLANFAVKVVALGVIPADRKPSTGMAWLLLVLLNTVRGARGLRAVRVAAAGPPPAGAPGPGQAEDPRAHRGDARRRPRPGPAGVRRHRGGAQPQPRVAAARGRQHRQLLPDYAGRSPP